METYLAIIKVDAEFKEQNGQLGYRVIYPSGQENWIP